MKIFILFTYGFPNGFGAVARVRAYATGLKRSGADVEVLCPKPTESNSGGAANTQVSGMYEGVPFHYTCGTSRRHKISLMNKFLFIKGIVAGAKLIAKSKRDDPNAAILAYGTDSSFDLLCIWCIARFTRTTLIGDRVEFPFVYSKKNITTKIQNLINNTLLYKRFDGIIGISRYLSSHFQELLGPGFPVITIPILVDLERFRGTGDAPARKKIVAYAGYLDHKGEAETLLESFSLAARDDEGWELRVIGPAPPGRMEALQKMAAGRRVQFLGMVKPDMIPCLLRESSILVLPRLKGLFSQAGFPTKLGEYLAAGRPVVVTETGDIGYYLKDGESAYLVREEDAASFSKKLRYVMDNPEEAEKVAARGRLVAEECFDTGRQCSRLIEWIEHLRSAGSPTSRAHAS